MLDWRGEDWQKKCFSKGRKQLGRNLDNSNWMKLKTSVVCLAFRDILMTLESGTIVGPWERMKSISFPLFHTSSINSCVVSSFWKAIVFFLNVFKVFSFSILGFDIIVINEKKCSIPFPLCPKLNIMHEGTRCRCRSLFVSYTHISLKSLTI